MTTETKNTKTGRPKGAKTADRPLVDSLLSRCPTCGSTERTTYNDVKPVYGEGVHNGRPYTAVKLRPTKCLNCGMHRTDREHEYVPGIFSQNDSSGETGETN